MSVPVSLNPAAEVNLQNGRFLPVAACRAGKRAGAGGQKSGARGVGDFANRVFGLLKGPYPYARFSN